MLTIGEIHKEIEKLPQSKKKHFLHQWVNVDLKERFKNRIINFDLQTASVWGKIQAQAEGAGKTMPTIDALIAATGICNDFIVVTRDTSDMEISGVSLYNPWK